MGRLCWQLSPPPLPARGGGVAPGVGGLTRGEGRVGGGHGRGPPPQQGPGGGGGEGRGGGAPVPGGTGGGGRGEARCGCRQPGSPGGGGGRGPGGGCWARARSGCSPPAPGIRWQACCCPSRR